MKGLHWNIDILMKFLRLLPVSALVHGWDKLYCKQKIEFIDPNTNMQVGKYVNNQIVWNHLRDNRVHAIPRITYDYNNNGVYGEPGEVEHCKWLSDSATTYLTTFFGGLLVLYILSEFRLWNCDRTYKNKINEKTSYDDLYNKVEERLEALQEQFELLSREEQEELVRLELADQDANNKITLKYICPISRQLIVWPVKLTTTNNTGEPIEHLYNLNHILLLIREKFPDPLTRRPVVSYGFSEQVNNDYKEYLHKLEMYMNPETRHILTNKRCLSF